MLPLSQWPALAHPIMVDAATRNEVWRSSTDQHELFAGLQALLLEPTIGCALDALLTMGDRPRDGVDQIPLLLAVAQACEESLLRPDEEIHLIGKLDWWRTTVEARTDTVIASVHRGLRRQDMAEEYPTAMRDRKNELRSACWRRAGLTRAADLLDIGNAAFSAAANRGEAEFRGRWALAGRSALFPLEPKKWSHHPHAQNSLIDDIVTASRWSSAELWLDSVEMCHGAYGDPRRWLRDIARHLKDDRLTLDEALFLLREIMPAVTAGAERDPVLASTLCLMRMLELEHGSVDGITWPGHRPEEHEELARVCQAMFDAVATRLWRMQRLSEPADILSSSRHEFESRSALGEKAFQDRFTLTLDKRRRSKA